MFCNAKIWFSIILTHFSLACFCCSKIFALRGSLLFSPSRIRCDVMWTRWKTTDLRENLIFQFVNIHKAQRVEVSRAATFQTHNFFAFPPPSHTSVLIFLSLMALQASYRWKSELTYEHGESYEKLARWKANECCWKHALELWKKKGFHSNPFIRHFAVPLEASKL